MPCTKGRFERKLLFMEGSEGRRWTRPLAVALGTLVVLETVGAWVAAVSVGWSLDDAFEAFVVTNSALALSFAVCGSIIAFHRPRNPIGWLFLADATGHGTSALMIPVAQLLHDRGGPINVQRLALTLYELAWPWSIALFLPLALMLFPDGRPPSPNWRPVVWGLILTAPLFVVSMAAEPVGPFPGGPVGYLKLRNYDDLSSLWILAEVRWVASMVLALAAMFLKYHRSDDTGRRQLLWVLLGTIAAIVFTVPWTFVSGTPIGVLLAIPLVPVAVAIGVLRYQLLDIRLVVSRTLAFILLSVATAGIYIAMVAVLDSVVSDRFGGSAVATAVLVVLISPLLPRTQKLVDRAMYGDRRDPARFASQVGEELVAHPEGELGGVAEAVRKALRLPYVAIRAGEQLPASVGEAAGVTDSLELRYAGRPVGELVVGLRPGESELSAADRSALALVTAPLAVAIHSTMLSRELQQSREQIVAAREEERRRLRRDLHDGLGPTLTGMALTADATCQRSR